MYGIASDDRVNKYQGSPLPVKADGVRMFEQLCSSLLPPNYKSGDPIPACCDVDQLQVFYSGIDTLKSLMSDCEICRENIQRLTCNLVCHPLQSNFTLSHVDPTNETLLEGLEAAMSFKFAEGLFNSCKDVRASNLPVSILEMICTLDALKCDPYKLVDSLLHNSQFNLTVHIIKEGQKPPSNIGYVLDPKVLMCNNSYPAFNRILDQCSCQDCSDSCPAPISYEPNKVIVIFGYFTLYQFVILALYLLFIILFIPWYIYHITRRSSETLLYEDTQDVDLENYNSESLDHINHSNPLISSITPNLQRIIQERIKDTLMAWAKFVLNNKIIFVILPVLLLLLLCSGCFYFMEFTSDPIEIWSPPNSKTRKYKNYFDTNFGPFYRTEQVIIKAPSFPYEIENFHPINVTFGPPLHFDVLVELFRLQHEIESLQGKINQSNGTTVRVTLNDVCHKPLEPLSSKCTIFSPLQYFQNNFTTFNNTFFFNDWKNHLYYCVNRPLSISDEDFDGVSCFSDFFSPVNPQLVLGGYEGSPTNASSLVLTYVVKNYRDTSLNEPALAWEKEFINYLKNFNSKYIKISYSAERSVQDEIDRQTHTEVFTISISYLVMFIYASLALGFVFNRGFKVFLIKQKISIAFVGVVLVLLSLLAAIGLFGYMKYRLNMIVLEVLPFLLLAVGVDNIFLLVNEVRRVSSENQEASILVIISRALGSVGQGMAVSSIAQISCFFIGAISNIPAVRTFSLLAATAIAINYTMQMTLFIVLLSLDFARERAGRSDIFCCLGMYPEDSDIRENALLEIFFKKFSDITISRYVKPFVIFFFVSLWFLAAFFITSIRMGLDQTTALPKISYLQNYFKDVFNELRSGPPVYFMVNPSFHYENKDKQNLICSGSKCNQKSLVNTIYQFSHRNDSYIATPANSWLDTYLAWIKSSGEMTCCRYKIDSTGKTVFCPSYSSLNDSECKPCFTDSIQDLSSEQFAKYLPWFLSDIPCKSCPMGGKPLFGSAVVLDPDYYASRKPSASPVLTSHFMSYHTSLSSGDDLSAALASSLYISDVISKSINHEVVPYSVFYVFYETSLTIWKELGVSFALSLAVMTAVNLLLYGFDFRMTIIMTSLIYLMNLLDMGLMFFLNIHLNPVSLVNLIMFLGLNVEFTSHIGRSFLSADATTRDKKAKIALIRTGSSVFSGITLTKLLGVLVLSFSTSDLFKVYYFQMYVCGIVVGALHGLILLPILLSYFGPVYPSLPSEEVGLLDQEEE